MNDDQVFRITEIAAEVAVNTYNELKKQESAQLGRKLRHNTVKLLKHYNKLKIFVDNAITDSTKAEDSWLRDMLTEMFGEVDDVKLQSVIRTKERTELMMKHMNNMLDIYADRCAAADVQYCECLRRRYINGEDEQSIADDLHVDPRTIRRYVRKGVEELSVLMWGVLGLNAHAS